MGNKLPSEMGVSVRNSEADNYYKVLSNPFDYSPVRLGGENMQPSGLATLVWRGVVVAGTNGQASFVFYPWATNPLLVSPTLSAPYTYTAVPGLYPGTATIEALAANGRIVSSGIRLVTTESATNNQGIITIGCLPRTNALPTGGVTIDGFPYGATTTATQGYNEFFNYLQTESYPLKCGASAFYRPEDPLDFTFRGMNISGVSDIYGGDDLLPFMVVGISGALSGAHLLIEVVTHIEYTVVSGTTGVVNTGMGSMGVQDVINTGKALFGKLTDTTIEGVNGGLLGKVASTLGRVAYDRISDSVGNYFSNSNNVMRGPYSGKSYRL
jgi:hypothetical protein